MTSSYSQEQPAHDTTDKLTRSCTPPQILNDDERRAAIQATPLAMKSAGTDQFTSTHVFRDVRMTNMAYEAQDHIVGPMPLDKFVNLFLPKERLNEEEKPEDLDRAKSDKAKFDMELGKMLSCKYEIEGVKAVCPNFPAVDTSETGYPSFKEIKIKPDVTFFQKGFRDKTDITMVEMMAEFKVKNSDDAFTSCTKNRLPDHIEKYTDAAKDTLGQITAYATAHKSSQFRTHLFSLLVFKEHARILFWDCTGVVVTELFLLTDDYFIEFFIRYNKATEEQRGYDTTVKSLSEEEMVGAEQLFPKNAKLFKLSVDSSEYVIERTLWMGPGSPFGRSTRPFTARLLSNTSVSTTPVFLKDTWRVMSRQREDSVYERLQAKGVPFVGTLLESGDIPLQVTRVQEIAKDADQNWGLGVPTELRKLHHFRLVLKEVATELITFRSTSELIGVLCDALEAHRAAYEDAHILHRDISVGNILIGPDRRGLLVDWDLVKDRDDMSQSASERTGTWQFMAGRLLTAELEGEASPIPNLADDLESFVHVLTWVTFRYTPTKHKIEALTDFIQITFDRSFKVDGAFRGNDVKGNHLVTRAALKKLPDSLLKELLNCLFEGVGVRYEAEPNEHPSREESHASIIEQYKEQHGQSEFSDAVVRQIQQLLEKTGWPGDQSMKYKQRLRELESSDWMIGVFKKFLAKPGWPVNDAAHENLLKKVVPEPTRKRPSEIWGDVAQDQSIDEGPSVSKKPRLSGIPEKD